jgi:ABC-type proline/glycine betaine transport system ATPase subunit
VIKSLKFWESTRNSIRSKFCNKNKTLIISRQCGKTTMLAKINKILILACGSIKIIRKHRYTSYKPSKRRGL